ncbi:unnamed protein product [Bursaphelenchus xylophilus]|uniref:(pine wood nematode) hypothetical protein n=1 Tax=Bursaphelenchus xylophilus TaxID=6326 RepID=A0A1I7S5V0_BURXY|nr:unnamed protein product [Bursaphelenchus xylophilus]CAG9125087.1 unnamed protein product [Bursaphelenchus xylophilus]
MLLKYVLFTVVYVVNNVNSVDPINGIVRDVAYIARNAWEQIVGQIKLPRITASENGFSFQLDEPTQEIETHCPRCLPASPHLLVGTWNAVLWSQNFHIGTMTDLNSIIDKLEQGKPIYTEMAINDLLVDAPEIYCPRLTVLNATDVTRFEFIYQVADGRQKSIIGPWENLRDGTFFWRIAPTLHTRLCVAFATVNQNPAASDFVILNQVDSWPQCSNFIALAKSRAPEEVNNLRDFMEQQNLDGVFNKVKKLYCPGSTAGTPNNSILNGLIPPQNGVVYPPEDNETTVSDNAIDPFALPREEIINQTGNSNSTEEIER